MNMKAIPRSYLIGGGVALVSLLLIMLFVTKNGVTNDGNKKQQDMIVWYNNTTNVLSDCLVKTKTAAGVTNAQSKALDTLITDAVRGRYTPGSTAKPGTGTLFSAIAEQYPNTSGLSSAYRDALIVITGCRSDFRDAQSELQKAGARFEQWRTGSWTVRTFGGGNYPNNALAIQLNGKTVTGKAALDQMRRLVVVSDAQSGRDTGVIENTDPFATP